MGARINHLVLLLGKCPLDMEWKGESQELKVTLWSIILLPESWLLLLAFTFQERMNYFAVVDLSADFFSLVRFCEHTFPHPFLWNIITECAGHVYTVLENNGLIYPWPGLRKEKNASLVIPPLQTELYQESKRTRLTETQVQTVSPLLPAIEMGTNLLIPSSSTNPTCKF